MGIDKQSSATLKRSPEVQNLILHLNKKSQETACLVWENGHPPPKKKYMYIHVGGGGNSEKWFTIWFVLFWRRVNFCSYLLSKSWTVIILAFCTLTWRSLTSRSFYFRIWNVLSCWPDLRPSVHYLPRLRTAQSQADRLGNSTVLSENMNYYQKPVLNLLSS